MRAVPCEAQEAAARDPGADPRPQVSGAPLLRPPCLLSPLFFPLVCVRAHLTPCPVLKRWYTFVSLCVSGSEQRPWGWAAHNGENDLRLELDGDPLRERSGGFRSSWLP